MVRRFVSAACFAAAIGVAPAARVAGAQAPAAQNSTKAMRAERAPSPLVVDGVLDDAAWRRVDPVTDFVQREPHVDQPVSERTEVRILFDNEALYVGVTCHDSQPGGVIARERRRDIVARDEPLRDDDHFEIVLDTFHDHRNGYHFAINPLGTQYDALITDEGHDVNVEWDERWWSEARITDEGWTAEIKIPFRALRSREGIDAFGVNFKRFIRRKNEIAQWTGWNRDYTALQISQAGHLYGVEGIRTGLKLRLKPYVLAGVQETSTTGSAERVSDAGIEVLKFSLTPGLTAEVSVNTDFAQTEVDDAVVNLTRFPLFFPEKREFFLERAGIFDFGPGGRRGGQAERNLQMFFSRRIGLTEDRVPVPIIAGARLSGRAAGFDLGTLNLQTDRLGTTPGSNYTVIRAKRNVLARSNIGAFFSNRQSSATEYNRVFGADANFTILKNTDVQGFVGKSSTPGRTGNDYVSRAKYNWFTDRYEAFLEHVYVGPDFQHDVGFVRRRGIQRSNAAFIWQPRPGVLDIRNFVVRGEVTYLTDIHRLLQTREQIFQWTARFQSDDAVRVNTTQTLDRLDRGFEISPGITLPPGEYVFRDTFVEAEGSPTRPLSGRIRYGRGSFYDGTRQTLQVAPAFKPFPLLSFESAYEYNQVDLREGRFTTHVFNARANLNVSNKWLTTTLAQYDSASRRRVLFFRLNYLYRPGDDLFVVLNRTDDREPPERRPDYAVMVKLTRSFDF